MYSHLIHQLFKILLTLSSINSVDQPCIHHLILKRRLNDVEEIPIYIYLLE